jgi:hypothetical protein
MAARLLRDDTVPMLRGLASLLSSLLLVAVPALTVWLASSLVAFHGGPPEASVAAGLLLFPALPLWWEWRAFRAFRQRHSRMKQFGVAPKRSLSVVTRLGLRTLAIGLVFLIGMVAAFPKTTFAALSTRGDWFLPEGDRAQPLRTAAFALAQGLEGLHELANPNPFATAADRSALAQLDPRRTTPTTTTVPSGSGARWRQLTPQERAAREGLAPRPSSKASKLNELDDPDGTKLTDDDDEPTASAAAKLTEGDDTGWSSSSRGSGQTPSIARLRESDAPDPVPSSPPMPSVVETGGTHWPWKAEVSPLVKAMRPGDETSLAAVAVYIASREPDRFRRVKALHDWVVTRLEYDQASTVPSQRKAQDAESVFRNRVAVCEGYARTLVALGQLTGDHIVYVTGDVREQSGAAAPVGHAWNAVEVDGAWYLIDATWDDPVDERGRSTHYRTQYLFIPPDVAVWSHFPDDPRWQLLPVPLTRGAFLRQPFTRPGIAVHGLTLVWPSRVTVESAEVMPVRLLNPRKRWLIVTFKDALGRKTECATTNADPVDVRCPIPASGELALFANREQYGQYEQVVSVEVTRR